MERVVLVSKDKQLLGVNSDEVFYKPLNSLFFYALEGHNTAFFYDKLGDTLNQAREHNGELFSFLDNLGNVVATNNEQFLNFLDGTCVNEYMERRYNTVTGRTLNATEKKATYLTVKVPVLDLLWNVLEGSRGGLTKVLCVGFKRPTGSSFDNQYDFESSFAVFDSGNGMEIIFGEKMDFSSDFLKERYDSLRRAQSSIGVEKVVNLISSD
nr:p24 [Pineapple mealybug wilt-associated virus 3]